jgi:hypothetical protein
MAKRVAGICYIKVDGEQLEVSGGIECPLLEAKREAVMGLSGVAGFKETAVAPFIKVSAVFTPDFPLDALQNNTEMTITAELANGKVYTLSGGFLVGEPSVKAEDGTTELEFNGKKGIWQ